MKTLEITPIVHEWIGPTGVKFRDVRQPSGTYYREGTPEKVIMEIESAMHTSRRVRIFLGDKETGRDWLEEWDVVGYIGRTTGKIKIPILLRNSRSSGGGAILIDCIVRLMIDGKEVYRHPSYNIPELTIGEAWEGVKVGVYANGEAHAGFNTLIAAQRWIEFMQGKRMGK